MKRFVMVLVGAVLAIASMQVSAQATTLDLGDVTASVANDIAGSAPGPLSYDVTFSLTAESNVALLLANFVTADFHISNLLATSSDLTLTGALGGPFSFAGILAAGDYLLHVMGTADGTAGGLFQVTLAATTTPIPGALLLFVTAIVGMAGFAGLRRRGFAAV